jgi:hypothetical protein
MVLMEKKERKKKINLYGFHSLFEENILISYKGPFDKNILSYIGNYLRVIISKNSKISKKIFSIFIELAQNISFYSAEKEKITDERKGIGTLVIGEFQDYYSFGAGNVVNNKDIIPVIEKCEIINSLDREGLRRYKREQRNLPLGNYDGAHIGLIQVALTAANPLDIEVNPIDSKTSFFSIQVKIDKSTLG